MTPRRFEVFTQRSGDTVFSTRFRVVARIVTRFVRTLDYDHPIPFVPFGPNSDPSTTTCIFCPDPALMLTDAFNPVCARHADATYH